MTNGTLDDTLPTLPERVESEHLGGEADAEDTPLKSRLVLPLLVPLVAIAVVAVLVLNISRVFLAGDEDVALITGIALTLAILVGASLLAAAPRLRSATLAVILGGMFVVVSGAGLVSLGPSLDDGDRAPTGWVEPTEAPTSTISVQAGPGQTFDGVTSGRFETTAGVVAFAYGGVSGHTLAIEGAQFDGFLLSSGADGPHTGKVKLEPGTYTIYCTIGTHAEEGMKATLAVS